MRCEVNTEKADLSEIKQLSNCMSSLRQAVDIIAETPAAILQKPHRSAGGTSIHARARIPVRHAFLLQVTQGLELLDGIAVKGRMLVGSHLFLFHFAIRLIKQLQGNLLSG